MTENHELSNLYPCFPRKLEDVSEIVIHGTGGGTTAASLIKWMLSGGRAEEYKKGIALFHFLVDRSGEIVKLYDISRWMYHSSSGQHDKCTIGIEMMNPSGNNQTEYTTEQYNSLADLVKSICDMCKIKSVVGHGYNKQKFSGEYKVCPGRFDWFNFAEILKIKGLNFTVNGESLNA